MLGKNGTTSKSGITAHLAEAAPLKLPPPATMVGGESSNYGSYNCKNYYGYEESVEFLKRCGLCNRWLSPGRDIYMYRGDAAFCSVECREQQMEQDESKRRRAASTEEEHHHDVAEDVAEVTGEYGTVSSA